MIVSDGISQARRFPRVFADAYFKPDERSFEDLLVFCSDLAKNLDFVDANNDYRGSWEDLFLASEIFVMAKIMAVDVGSLDREYRHKVHRHGVDGAMEMILRVSDMLESWHRLLQAGYSGSDQVLGSRIADLIKNSLSEDLHSAADRFSQRHTLARGTTTHLSRYSPEWGLGELREDAGFAKSSYGQRTDDSSAADFYRARYYAFIKGIAYIQRVTKDRWESTLSSQTVNPALGLIVAFARLFETVQGRLNEFPGKFRRFYYDDVLGIAASGSTPDRADVALQLDRDSADLLLRSGTEFTAGMDAAGNDRVFVSANELLVRNLSVNEVYTLGFIRDETKSPERELGYVTGVRQSKTTPERLGDDPDHAEWPVLGDQPAVGDRPAEQSTQLGFAIASSQLLLREGQRRVAVELHVQPPGSWKRLLSKLQTAGELAAPNALGDLFVHYLLRPPGADVDEIRGGIRDWVGLALKSGEVHRDTADLVVEYLDRDRRSLFFYLLQDSLRLAVTTPDGWHGIENFTMERTTESSIHAPAVLRFEFTLEPRAPGLSGYREAIHGGNWRTSHPVISFLVNAQTHFCPISVFSRTQLKYVSIEAEVEGVVDLRVANQDGPTDIASAFPAFGPIPADGAFLVIGSPELALKAPESMSIDIEWADLPRTQGGLAKRYEDYEQNYSDDQFTVELSVLKDAQWQVSKDESSRQRPIFVLDEQTGVSRKDVSLDVGNAMDWQRLTNDADMGEMPLDENSPASLLKLTLTCPPQAFGHNEYPALMATALARNAKRKGAAAIPPEPYVPSVRRLALNYRVSGAIDLSDPASANSNLKGDEFFHVHPFGVQRYDVDSAATCPELLPDYGHDANLFVGFSAEKAGGALSLYLDIEESAWQSLATERSDVRWYYMASETWQQLPDWCVTIDSTNGLRAPGIVSIDIPDAANTEHQAMPRGYWLRAAAPRHSPGFGSLRAIHANAVNVVRRTDGASGAETDGAGTVNDTLVPTPGLGGVRQLRAGYGGLPAESEKHRDTRVAERLRHKCRAVSPWDYERLVLQAFPSVYKAKCFAAMGHSEPDVAAGGAPLRPGEILVVVVPMLTDELRKSGEVPRLNVKELSSIRDYLRSVCPPAAKVHVRNPVYERLQVRCSVKFAATDTSGMRAQQLNDDICNYLSPWGGLAHTSRFGWRVRCQDVESHIRDLDYVEFVSGLSILHVSEGRRHRYYLSDTERPEEGKPDAGRYAGPRVPWGLAIPFRKHAIHVLRRIGAVNAHAVGVGELEVGRTFIL